jgi:hypothetical protein
MVAIQNTQKGIYNMLNILHTMQRKSKELELAPNTEIVLHPADGGLLKYPTDAVLTVQVGEMDGTGQFSRIKETAGCKAILIVLKDV